jgi:hypothetical protein
VHPKTQSLAGTVVIASLVAGLLSAWAVSAMGASFAVQLLTLMAVTYVSSWTGIVVGRRMIRGRPEVGPPEASEGDEPRGWWTYLFDPYGRSQVWRSAEKWRRRDSVFVAGVLAFVSYLLVAIIISGAVSLGGQVAIAVPAAPLIAATTAEVLYAVSPTQTRLRRSDRLIVLTVAVFLAVGVFVLLAPAATRLFS